MQLLTIQNRNKILDRRSVNKCVDKGAKCDKQAFHGSAKNSAHISWFVLSNSSEKTMQLWIRMHMKRKCSKQIRLNVNHR